VHKICFLRCSTVLHGLTSHISSTSQRALYNQVNPVVPPPTPPTNAWLHDGFDRIDTPAPTDGWAGDAFQPLPAPVSKGGAKLVYVKVEGGSSKSKGYGLNVSGVGSSKSDKGFIFKSEGVGSKSKGVGSKSKGFSSKSDKGFSSKSDKGFSSKSDKGVSSINVSGVSGKSNKGLNVSGVSSKSDKGYGFNVSGGSSKSKGASGVYINVSGGKSNKGTPDQPDGIVSINNSWHDDGFQPAIKTRSSWQDDGFETIVTPSPTTWSGDAFEPLPAPLRNDWSDDGWDDDKYPAPANAAKGSSIYYVNVQGKVNKGSSSLNVSGVSSKSDKGYGIAVSGGSSKSKGFGFNASGVSSKSNKALNVSGVSSKSDKGVYGIGVSSKSDKGYGFNVSGGSSKSKGASGVYVSGGSSKSKGTNSIYINVSGGKSNKASPANPVNPLQPIDGWNNDGYVPVPVPAVRGKWSGDGHVSSLITPNPTPYPTWRGDAHPLVTPQPTPKPTWQGDAHTPAPSTCEEIMLWHPNTDYTTCTNDNNYVPGTEYIYESLQLCCMSVFGTLSCPYIDICVTEPIVTPEPTPSPTTCEERKFYAVKNGDQLYCSNGYDIPAGWAGSEYYFDTLQACCEAEFGSSSCAYQDVCVTPSPSESPIESPVTPAPTPCEAQVFFFDGNSCSNEIYIADASAYTSVMVCCNINFGTGSFMNGSCNYVDICNTPMPSSKPTPNPTPNPTPKPSPAPITPEPTDAPITPEPTDAPITPEPTDAPITPAPTPCEAQVFFFDGNVCSNDIYIADASAYTSVMICCNMNFGTGSFTNGGCEYVDICNTLPPSPSPSEPIVTPSPATPEPTESPVTPAPTPCEALAFFFDGEVCSNDIFIADAASYNSAEICCNMNFGTGSFMSGSCNYVDICNTLPPSPAPTFLTTPGSTPTVSKETTGPPTMPAGRGDERNEHAVTTDVTTDCREITGGYPKVCVKVCTSIKSTYKGGVLIDETAETSEEQCD
jgi:hypothetical protein